MSLSLIVRRSLNQHRLSTIVTVMSVALGTGLVMAVFSLQQQAHDTFVNTPTGFDAVLGGRGSRLQLVMNSVFHLDEAPGKIRYSLLETMRKQPGVEAALPMMVGDNYYGFRIVGSTSDIFTYCETPVGRGAQVQPGGRLFDDTRAEAVVGCTVAQRTGLHVGSVFQPYHGLSFDPSSTPHNVDYLVTGVLQPTYTPLDRVILIPIEGLWRMPGHFLADGSAAAPSHEIADENKEISAVLIRYSRTSGRSLEQLHRQYDYFFNKQGSVATYASVPQVMSEFLGSFGWVVWILGMVAWLVVVVAAGSIMAILYNTMNERRREFAILRALGARRRTVVSAIVAEAATISLLGTLV
ncbi:MAG: ABC transporter permease, partial [Planctomycetota bacterium]